MAVFDLIFSADTSSDCGRSIKEKDGCKLREDEDMSPFILMDVACRLILALVGAED